MNRNTAAAVAGSGLTAVVLAASDAPWPLWLIWGGIVAAQVYVHRRAAVVA